MLTPHDSLSPIYKVTHLTETGRTNDISGYVQSLSNKVDVIYILTIYPPLMLLTQMALPGSQLMPSSVSGLRLRHTVKLNVPVVSMSNGLASPDLGITIPYNGRSI